MDILRYSDDRASRRLPTDAVLTGLAARGLESKANRLAQDVKDRYLPRPEMEPRGNAKGIGRLWTWEAYRRAVRLYRLRNRGVQGDLLRVLLFMSDGWGWEDVRPICLAGLRKLVHVQKSQVVRNTRTHSEPYIEDVALRLDPQTPPKNVSDVQIPEAALYLWGVGFFGKPLRGGSLWGLMSELHLSVSPVVTQVSGDSAISDLQALAADLVFRHADLSWEHIDDAIGQASETDAYHAWRLLRTDLHMRRASLHTWHRKEGIKHQSTNPLTFCNHSGQTLREMFRNLPTRLTPAQGLAVLMVPAIIVEALRWQVWRDTSAVAPDLGQYLHPIDGPSAWLRVTNAEKKHIRNRIRGVFAANPEVHTYLKQRLAVLQRHRLAKRR